MSIIDILTDNITLHLRIVIIGVLTYKIYGSDMTGCVVTVVTWRRLRWRTVRHFYEVSFTRSVLRLYRLPLWTRSRRVSLFHPARTWPCDWLLWRFFRPLWTLTRVSSQSFFLQPPTLASLGLPFNGRAGRHHRPQRPIYHMTTVLSPFQLEPARSVRRPIPFQLCTLFSVSPPLPSMRLRLPTRHFRYSSLHGRDLGTVYSQSVLSHRTLVSVSQLFSFSRRCLWLFRPDASNVRRLISEVTGAPRLVVRCSCRPSTAADGTTMTDGSTSIPSVRPCSFSRFDQFRCTLSQHASQFYWSASSSL